MERGIREMAKTQLNYIIGLNTREAAKALAELGKELKKLDKEFKSFGKAWSAGISIPLMSLGKLSGKIALDIQAVK